jgi:hypothetical protein
MLGDLMSSFGHSSDIVKPPQLCTLKTVLEPVSYHSLPNHEVRNGFVTVAYPKVLRLKSTNHDDYRSDVISQKNRGSSEDKGRVEGSEVETLL